MKWGFAFFFCFVLSITAFAQAKTPDEEFCAMAPVEMLAALDGNWKLKPGAGVAVTGIGALPLPPQKVQKLSFTYNPDSATVTIVDAKTGQDFILLPTTPEAAKIVLGLMKDWYKEDYLKEGEGCDWYSIPLMIASNVYLLKQEASDPDTIEGVVGVFADFRFIYCPNGSKDNPNDTFLMFEGSPGLSPVELMVVKDNPNFICEVSKVPPQGELVMNLILKFQSPSSATGVLYFEGDMDGSKAIAIRPVTLSR